MYQLHSPGRGLEVFGGSDHRGLIARGLVVDGGDELSDADILDIATEMEGHPDNVAAALLGGFTTAWLEAESAGCVRHISSGTTGAPDRRGDRCCAGTTGGDGQGARASR